MLFTIIVHVVNRQKLFGKIIPATPTCPTIVIERTLFGGNIAGFPVGFTPHTKQGIGLRDLTAASA